MFPTQTDRGMVVICDQFHMVGPPRERSFRYAYYFTFDIQAANNQLDAAHRAET
jgi:hypothetical protein